ncbi:DUF3418 domain-containing protein [Micromonospora sp. DT47]|uniref:DUF3418 domain-containing protein n=1 Tax=Micromonospora sp. DT47 TaxID=3393431 RepID=UPI003CF68A34
MQSCDQRADRAKQARRAPDGRPPGQHLGQARRMLEKYRVQLWAQQLGTAQTVSDARIRKMLSP